MKYFILLSIYIILDYKKYEILCRTVNSIKYFILLFIYIILDNKKYEILYLDKVFYTVNSTTKYFILFIVQYDIYKQ
jgi:hypothetical protein